MAGLFQDGERAPLDECATGLGRGDGGDAYLYCACGFNAAGGDRYAIVYITGRCEVVWTTAYDRSEAERLLGYPPPQAADESEWFRGDDSPLLAPCRCGLSSPPREQVIDAQEA